MNKDKEVEVRKIGLVGGGTGAAKLLPIFSELDSSQVEFVVDQNQAAPAMELARKHDIDTSTELIETLNDYSIDLIFELTGSEQVLTTIKDNKSKGQQVITGHSSYFIFNFIKGYQKFQQQLISKVIAHLQEVHRKLGTDSENLGELLTKIKEATKRLSRLAINASIEANKAGEEGRGFSVVAEEVKQLAAESSQLVDNIEEINVDISGLNQQLTEIVDRLKSQLEEIKYNEQEEQETKVIKVGIIGAGEMGSNLLNIFVNMESIKVCCIADQDQAAPGLKLARKEDLLTTTDIMEVIDSQELDVILEVTDSDQVLATVEENKRETTEVITGVTSYLVYDIIKEYEEFQNQLLQKVIGHLNEIYTEIESDSGKINNFLTEIEKVTKNLNMLAVNASIEAARAGEKGTDFALVAEEVKELSDKSNDLVQNIEEINTDIINLNSRITEVVDELENQSK